MTIALFVLAGALLAGFVNGLAGFGTGLVALGLWLHVIDPVLAAPLVVICSVAAQILSLVTLRPAFNLYRIWPFLTGGLLGVPIGVLALDHIEVGGFRIFVGTFLILYCAFTLASRRLPVLDRGGRPADGAVGFAGGILGGAAGLSGVLPTVWCGLKGWGKTEQRAVYQPFNLAVLSWALIAQAQQGFITAEVGRLTLICLPGTVLGVWLGIKAFGRVDDRQFRLIILWLLLASGGVLTVTNLVM
ncbi:MAG: sulfite exporter TauE/SafE family protein [Alphaproteobacteria bacterium]|nr:sulfite exporter TauE/SafE family protein [Alphaproteobacteria bacterium]